MTGIRLWTFTAKALASVVTIQHISNSVSPFFDVHRSHNPAKQNDSSCFSVK